MAKVSVQLIHPPQPQAVVKIEAELSLFGAEALARVLRRVGGETSGVRGELTEVLLQEITQALGSRTRDFDSFYKINDGSDDNHDGKHPSSYYFWQR